MQLLDGVVAVAGHLVTRLVDLAQVGERDLQALVQEGHLLETGTQGFEIVFGGFEDRRIGPERHRGSGRFLRAHRLALLERRGRLLVDVGLRPVVALTAHLDVHPRGQRVDHRDADAVQTAGHRVAAAAELAAGVQFGHHGLHAGDAGRLHDVHGDASAVVVHAHAVARQDGDLDVRGESGQGLVHGIVHDLIHQMVQATGAGGADVHARADAHGFKPLQHLEVAGFVMLRGQGIVQLGVLQVIVGTGGVHRIGVVQRVHLRVCHRTSFLLDFLTYEGSTFIRYALKRK